MTQVPEALLAAGPGVCRRMLLLARILAWPLDARGAPAPLPTCALVRQVGEAGNIQAETNALLLDNQIDASPHPPEALECIPSDDLTHTDVCWTQIDASPHPPEALECIPSDDFTIPPEEIARRRDLRALGVTSIDPATAKDLDDALHVRTLPDGRIEVGVHIADVSFFEAKTRATTTYLMDRCLPMLPHILSETLCS
ncbi:hypothetical protein T484DRAFT_1770395 [Baffinella frigidus]|nr:hypothetical protein T484DRAFT_1770395 [Cryptophyta sp. CCMP2293]